ncbi:MAG TPA: ABC transporter permease subunit [Aurantimonas sp.]|jgi:ABC-type transport system involved in multi-copper enzyme maturation permease subunit|nr:ABC transporter permease subunit [Aurantimonas sp.]
MAVALHPPGLLRVTLLLFRREMRMRLASLWFYAAASLVCLLAWFYGGGFQQSFRTESVLVAADPLATLDVLVVIFVALVLGLRLATAIAWEREHRTLEVLLVGPASHEAVVTAKFAVELCIFALLMAVYVLYLQVAQPLGPGIIDTGSALAVARMPVHALPVLALGLLVSAWARTVRGAVLAYLTLVVLLGVFEAVLGLLAARPPQELSLAAGYLRSAMQAVSPLIEPLSPVAPLANLVRSMTQDTAPAASQALTAIVLALVLLALAAAVSRLRGAIA